MKLPGSLENDLHAAAAFRIYASAWDSQLSTSDTHLIISMAANSLHQQTFSTTDIESAINGAVLALPAFFTLSPSSIDFGLSIFMPTANSLPDSVTHSYGTGSQGVKNILCWFLVEDCTFFQGLRGEQKLGKETADDRSSLDSSNIVFQPSEVAESGIVVRTQLEEFQKARTEIIVLMAMMGRCHAMDLARPHREAYKGDQIVGFVDLTLKHQYEGTPRWGKVDFVACCVMLRSCARSLIASLPEDVRDRTATRWKEEFARFLYGGEGGMNFDEDFAVKVHAARVLGNLESGPFDEDSTRLFGPAEWVF